MKDIQPTKHNSHFPQFTVVPNIERWTRLVSYDDLWSLIEEQLYWLHHGLGFRICGAVLMPTHLRILTKAPRQVAEGLEQLTAAIDQAVADLRSIAMIPSSSGHSVCFRSVEIPNQQRYVMAYRSLYRAPLQADLCEAVEQYPFSTLYGLLGGRHLLTPVEPDDILFSEVEGVLDWLNTPTAELS
jgi:hypothetical protein